MGVTDNQIKTPAAQVLRVQRVRHIAEIIEAKISNPAFDILIYVIVDAIANLNFNHLIRRPVNCGVQ